MTPEDYYKESGYPEMKDKRDKRIHQFSYYDLIDFAGRYCEKESKPSRFDIHKPDKGVGDALAIANLRTTEINCLLKIGKQKETISERDAEIEKLQNMLAGAIPHVEDVVNDDTIENGIKAINFMKGFNKG